MNSCQQLPIPYYRDVFTYDHSHQPRVGGGSASDAFGKCRKLWSIFSLVQESGLEVGSVATIRSTISLIHPGQAKYSAAYLARSRRKLLDPSELAHRYPELAVITGTVSDLPFVHLLAGDIPHKWEHHTAWKSAGFSSSEDTK